LEFDIGFLLDVCFLFHRQRTTSEPRRTAPIDRFPDRNPGSASTAAFGAAAPASYGIWYASNDLVKASPGTEVPKTLAT
jgi:hypothetical protein